MGAARPRRDDTAGRRPFTRRATERRLGGYVHRGLSCLIEFKPRPIEKRAGNLEIALFARLPSIARRSLLLLVAALSFTAIAVAADAESRPPPELRVSAPSRVAAGAPRDISVAFINPGGTAIVVLPNLLRLHIDDAGAQYLPYPGPAIDPWGGATELAPGGSTALVFRDASDRRGIWRLPPGEYRVSAVYDVPADLAAPRSLIQPDRVWRGQVRSPPVVMTVLDPLR